MLGIVLGGGYVIILTVWWRDILHHVFRFERGFVSVLLSAFAGLFFVSSIEASVVAFYTSTLFLTWTSLICSGVVTYLLRLFFLSRSCGSESIRKGRGQYIQMFPNIPWLSWIYISGWIVSVCLFFRAHGIDTLFSPWQSLSIWIAPLLFVLSVVLGFLIFSKQKTTQVLVLLLMHSFLLHLYLPLSHELPWGGDVWRHIAVESRLTQGEIVQPVLFGDQARWREVGGIDLPEAVLIPQKYTYGQFWSLAVIVNQVTGISLYTINIWLMPVLWSLLFPLILFRIGRIVFRSWRGGLVLAWLSFMAFPLQALGALTLPVSLAVLSFFFVLMLWLQYLGTLRTVQGGLCAIFFVLMLFGYALGVLLMLFVILGTWSLRAISQYARSRRVGWSLVFLLTVLGICIIPSIELLAGTSHLSANISVLYVGRQVIGELSGWLYASAIRPHDIASGNLFFNHTPDYAFVSSLFTSWRWWIIPCMIVLWVSALSGIYIYAKERRPLRFLVPAWIAVSLMGGYVIGWFLLSGDRLFVRRLDPFLSVLILLFVCVSICSLFHRVRFSTVFLRRSIALCILFVVSWFSMATYMSGPDMRVVSVDEFAISEFILNEIQDSSKPISLQQYISDTGEGTPLLKHFSPLFGVNICILADTWVLLPLEALSSGSIVGGNFPIGYQFGQEERISLYDTFLHGVVTTSTIHDMFAVSKKERCIVALPADDVSEGEEARITSFSSAEPIRYSGFLLWTVKDDSAGSLNIDSR